MRALVVGTHSQPRAPHPTPCLIIYYILYNQISVLGASTCYMVSNLAYREVNEFEVELRFVEDRYKVKFADAMAGSDASLTLKPSSMGFSVIKLTLPEENSTVISVCLNTTGAEVVDLLMWQKDVQYYEDPTNLVNETVNCSKIFAICI